MLSMMGNVMDDEECYGWGMLWMMGNVMDDGQCYG